MRGPFEAQVVALPDSMRFLGRLLAMQKKSQRRTVYLLLVAGSFARTNTANMSTPKVPVSRPRADLKSLTCSLRAQEHPTAV